MRLPQTTRKKARIEIIPMIDAIFFLLVFFMFSSLSMVKMNGLTVALPKAPPAMPPANPTGNPRAAAKPAGKPAVPHRLIVSLSARGVATLGATEQSDISLAQGLTRALTAHPDTVVVVRTAPGTTTQRLVETLDTLNGVVLPGGERPQVVVATVAAPPTSRTNVLNVPRAKGIPSK